MFGKYAAFIVPAYAISAAALAATTALIILTYRSRLRELARLEGQSPDPGAAKNDEDANVHD